MNRGAVVTGASSGIGAATAHRLAKEGFDVVIGARRADRLTEVAAAIDAKAIPLDVTDPQTVDAFVAQVPECRVLVKNAGGAEGLDPIESSSDDDWRWMFEANVLGTVRMTRAVLPKLARSERRRPCGHGGIGRRHRAVSGRRRLQRRQDVDKIVVTSRDQALARMIHRHPTPGGNP
jgi:NADP-dependent 3-hydroxy acid dehydrogenase YdfG